MSATPIRDRRAERYAATREEILEAAWELVREHGLSGLSLRDLGQRVGMKAQSLYSYFGSKNEIYDAMFAQGNRQFRDVIIAAEQGDDPRAEFKRRVRAFLTFSTEDPARYQLLFQRTIPGFEPSPESYAIAVEVLEHARAGLRRVGATEPADLDLWTAISSGLADQQIANDPGGTRWQRLSDEAVDMFLDHIERKRRARGRKAGR